MATGQLTLEKATAAIEASSLKRGPKAGGFYCPEGECYFVYLDDVLSYATRVDRFFTVYKAIEDDRLVGFQVKCTDIQPPHQLSYRLGRMSHTDPRVPIQAVELVVHALKRSADLQGGRFPSERDLSSYLSAVSMLGKNPVPVVDERELCGAR